MIQLLLRLVMKWSIFSFVFLLAMTPQMTQGQNAAIDSLKAIVQTGQKDNARVTALNALSSELIQIEELDQAMAYADQAIALADDLDFKKGKAYALKNKGLVEYYQSNYKEVLELWTESLQTFEVIQDTLGIANLSSNLGAVYYGQGSHAKSFGLLFESLSFSEKLGDPVRITSALLNIGPVYIQTESIRQGFRLLQTS